MTLPTYRFDKTPLLAAICGGLALSLALGADRAAAQEAKSPSFAFNLGVASDYVFRGVSQTDEEAQIFGGVDVSAGQFYAGVWGSNVDFYDSTDAEVDVYAGFKPTLGPATLDIGVVYYGYVNAPSGADYGNWEGKLAGSVPAGPGTVGAAVFYSPDGFGAADEAFYYEINGSYPATEQLSLSGAIARQTYNGPDDYTTWNVGATWSFAPHLAADIRYHDTDEHNFGQLYDSRVVVGLKATF